MLVFLFFIAACSVSPFVVGHPQCADFRPPFKPAKAIEFCRRYEYESCCTQNLDRLVGVRFRHFRRSPVGRNVSSRCQRILHDLGCLFCNPFAAHAFDLERRGPSAAAETANITARRIPGLCQSACADIYLECGGRALASFFFLPAYGTTEFPSQDELCSLAVVDDPVYCYPNILHLEVDEQPVGYDERPTGNSAASNSCFCVEEVVSGLVNPVAFVPSKDDTQRLFVVEQGGTVRIIKDKKLMHTAYLDLSKVVGTRNEFGDERGLLGLDFHPRFATNRRLVIYYNVYVYEKKTQQLLGRIAEYVQSPTNPDTVDHGSERVLLDVEQPEHNHNGGQVTFGPDGYLYVFLGDGGSAGDPHGERGNGQDKSNLLGAILRIDVDRQTNTTVQYAIPPDNPFLNIPNVRPEIFAFGLRNPWRCSFDQGDPDTGEGYGRLFCGDVGQNKVEEIDLIVKGGNYGWRAFEGSRCYDADMCPSVKDEAILPIHEYSLSWRQSVTGGYVYRGCHWPRLQGKYIYGDYELGKLYMLTEENGKWRNEEICLGSELTCTNQMRGNLERRILSFGEDNKGEIYILVTSSHSQKPLGKIYHLVDPQRRADPSSCFYFRLFAARNRGKSSTPQPTNFSSQLVTKDTTTTPKHRTLSPTRATTPITMATTQIPTMIPPTTVPSLSVPSLSVPSPSCVACRQRLWTSVLNACRMQYTHHLKVKVINEVQFERRQFVLLEFLPITNRQVNRSGQASVITTRARTLAYIWVLAESVHCNCPFLETGKTYVLLTYGNKNAMFITLKTFLAEWDDHLWPKRLTQLKAARQRFCSSFKDA